MEDKKIEEFEFELKPANQGLQVLVFSDDNVNLIMRNQQRNNTGKKIKYKITLEEIKDESDG